ncbi:unnamed protein product [Linum trigynum]|uniref:XS domain-containing protein n=1 Tax=Linum trigynum TaxID=586398 RepID=A0AAV2FU69_9ROSI
MGGHSHMNCWEDACYREAKNQKLEIEDPDAGCPGSDDGWNSAAKPNSDLVLDPTDQGEKIVFPWMGLVANIKTVVKNGKPVGESGSKLRDEFIRKGYNPMRVHALWDWKGHSGFAIVEFKKSWEGYRDALKFDKDFALMGCGKADDFSSLVKHEERLFGWIARDDEYQSTDVIGAYLRKKTDLKSLSDIVADGERKDSKLVSSLQDELTVKHGHLMEMETKYKEASVSIIELVSQKDAMIVSYNEEIRKMQQIVHNDFNKILVEHQRAKHELEARRTELEQSEKQLREREAHNENEIKKLHQQKEMNKRAILEQRNADEQLFNLAQEHQRAKEALHKKVIELQTQLDAKQALELEIEQRKGALQVLEHLEEGESPEIREMKEKLEEKEDELEYLFALNQTLMTKNEKVEQELGAGRKELINGFQGMVAAGRATIGLRKALRGKSKLSTEEAELWHLKEDREATVVEGVEYILRIWKRLK